MTQQNAALVEEASASSQSVANQATALNAMMSRYKVSKEAAAAVTAMNASAASQRASKPSTLPPSRWPASKQERRTAPRPWTHGAAKAPVSRAAGAAVANARDSDWAEF
jgi:methyl-accepting chemotaxis protein